MSKSQGYWSLIAICIAVYCDTLLYDIIVPFLPEHLSTETTFSTLATSLVIALYAVAFLVTQPFARRIYQKYGPFNCLFIGMCGMLAATLLPLIHPSLIIYFVARCIHGCAGCILITASFSVVAGRFAQSNRRGMAFSLLTSMASLGILTGPPLGGLLYEQWGTSAPFIVVTVVLLLAIGLCFRDRRIIPTTTSASNQITWREGLRRFGSTTVKVAWGSAALSMLDVALPVELLEEWNMSAGTIGITIAAAVLVYGIAASLSGWLSARLNRHTLMTLGMFLCATALAVLGTRHHIVVDVLVLASFAAGCAFLLNPACDELAAQAEKVGTGYEFAFGWFNVAYAFGNMFGPLSYGLIKHYYGMNYALYGIALSVLPIWWLTQRVPQANSKSNVDANELKMAA